MNKPFVYFIGLLSAFVAAFIVYVVVQDVFDIPDNTIALDSLGLAGLLGLFCVAAAIRSRG